MSLAYLFSKGQRPSQLFSLATAVVGLAFTVILFQHNAPTVRPSYEAQLKSLDNTKQAIQSLITFIDDQKKQLQLSQTAVDALKTEEGHLHPLVEADRKIIDALFAEQERRNQSIQSHERWIGFGLGALASLFATIIWTIVTRFLRNRSQQA